MERGQYIGLGRMGRLDKLAAAHVEGKGKHRVLSPEMAVRPGQKAPAKVRAARVDTRSHAKRMGNASYRWRCSYTIDD